MLQVRDGYDGKLITRAPAIANGSRFRRQYFGECENLKMSNSSCIPTTSNWSACYNILLHRHL